MYLKRFSIDHVKCFDEDVTLDFGADGGEIKRWNVILGENGTGKSTLLQAIGMALMGPDPANRLRRPDGWVRDGHDSGSIRAEILASDGDSLTGGGRPRRSPYTATYRVTGNAEIKVGGVLYDRPAIVFDGDKPKLNALKRGPLSERSTGWFSAGYGPYRRLRGGSPDALRLIYPGQKEARFVTLFREDAALEHLESWLKDLDHRSRAGAENGAHRAGDLLEIVSTITTNLLPKGVEQVEVNPDGIYYRTPYSASTGIQDLSDGYRSVLALSTDLLRRLDEAFQSTSDWFDGNKITAKGVVLIDELDAHLHPTWQREIGYWLQETFPSFQFIVATHSPFIPLAASTSGVYILRRQSGTSDARPNASVVAEQDHASVRGWRVDQILSVLFDVPTLRSPEAERKIRAYADLKATAAARALSAEERSHYEALDRWLDEHLSPPGDTEAEMQAYREAKQRVDAFLDTLPEED